MTYGLKLSDALVHPHLKKMWLRIASIVFSAALFSHWATALTTYASLSESYSQISRRNSQLSMGAVEVHFTLSNKKILAEGATPLSEVCTKAGIKVKYNCKQGNCGTCTINVDGRNVKACQTKLDPFRRMVKIKK